MTMAVHAMYLFRVNIAAIGSEVMTVESMSPIAPSLAAGSW